MQQPCLKSFSNRPASRYGVLPLIVATLNFCACRPSDTARAPDKALYGDGQIARSTEGMVVSASPIATAVGADVLGAGGNAVDAAVATAFALSVVEPTMSGLGGRTQMLIRTSDGSFVGLDGGTEVPRSVPEGIEVDEDEGGYEAIGIPGTVAALVAAAERHGTMPLARLVQPAIALAESGFALTESEAERIESVAGRLSDFAGSSGHFLQASGTAFPAGETFVQPELARVLQSIAESGAEPFYRGWIADSIAADMERNGGFVTREDLAEYEVLPSRIVRGSYRGFDLVGTYLPASGATTIEALQILESFEVDPAVGSPEWMSLAARALLASFEDRVADFGPPTEHAQRIVSREHATVRAAEIESSLPVPAGAASPEPAFTTHLSVADREGGMVALTQSVGPTMGSKVVTPGLGFVYAATIGYLADQRPGDRPFSSQSPLIVMRDDQPAMIIGASGARRIISAIVASVSRMIDGKMSLEDALALPRFHPSGQTLYVEHHESIGWTPEEIEGASASGFDIVPRDDPRYFAAIHGIAFDSIRAEFVGVSEPRRGGSASAPR